MRTSIVAALAVACLAASAAAQTPRIPRPNAPIPQVQPQTQLTAPVVTLRNGALLQNPPGNFTPPALTVQLLTADQMRKIALLREWGLNVTSRQLGQPIWLTPQHPYVDANTNITVYADGGATTTDLAVPQYGVIHIPLVSYEYLGHHVQLRVGNSRPNQWWLVECLENDPQPFWLSSSYPPGKAGEDLGMNLTMSRPRRLENGYVSALFEPNTQVTRTFMMANLHADHGWNFYGCQLTPVTP